MRPEQLLLDVTMFDCTMEHHSIPATYESLPEKWTPIERTDGVFEVSSHARVRSLDRVYEVYGKPRIAKGKILPSCDSNGYRHVSIKQDGVWKAVGVHRLVALHFVPCHGNPDEMHVNHIDFNRSNNMPRNLEWCTPAENNQHSRDAGRYPKKHPKWKLDSDDVAAVENALLSGSSVKDVARSLWIKEGQVRDILSGRFWYPSKPPLSERR